MKMVIELIKIWIKLFVGIKNLLNKDKKMLKIILPIFIKMETESIKI